MFNSISAAALLGGAAALAQQPPPEGVRGSRHENLAAAQELIRQAYQKITAAQEANHSDLGGHAQKAKDLLDQAGKECGMAAEFANKNRR